MLAAASAITASDLPIMLQADRPASPYEAVTEAGVFSIFIVS
jgi:hypothetical protein